jgi:hypothetical protein
MRFQKYDVLEIEYSKSGRLALLTSPRAVAILIQATQPRQTSGGTIPRRGTFLAVVGRGVAISTT